MFLRHLQAIGRRHGADHAFCEGNNLRAFVQELLGSSRLVQDAEMMEQIDRDVMRTHPGLHFFSGDDGAAVTHREVICCLILLLTEASSTLNISAQMHLTNNLCRLP